MKRLLLENDEEFDLDRIYDYLEDAGHKNVKDFFDMKIAEATFNSREVWEAIKQCDEIYAESGLIDNMGLNGGLLFNNMMYQTIKEGVEGKSVYLFDYYKKIWWHNLEKDLVDKALRKNHLYVMSETPGQFWEQVDIDKLIKENL